MNKIFKMAEMDTFDDFFSRQSEQFNSDVPPTGHEQRFMLRLQRRNRSRVTQMAISIAASVTLAVGLTAAMAWLYQGKIEEPAISHSNLVSDVEMYYNSLLQQKYREVEQVIGGESSDLRFEITRVMRDFERENCNLRNDLGEAQKKDYMVGLMVQNYQTQIDILNKIQSSIDSGKGSM